jgi:hypothetical protein
MQKMTYVAMKRPKLFTDFQRCMRTNKTPNVQYNEFANIERLKNEIKG